MKKPINNKIQDYALETIRFSATVISTIEGVALVEVQEGCLVFYDKNYNVLAAYNKETWLSISVITGEKQ